MSFTICRFCGDKVKNIHHHHLIPKSRGGAKGITIECCKTCSDQVHMLFTGRELANMTLEDLMSNSEMIKYIKWKRKHPGDHKVKMSRRVKKRGQL